MTATVAAKEKVFPKSHSEIKTTHLSFQQLNPYNSAASATLVHVVDMNNSLPDENNAAWVKETPDVKHYLALSLSFVNNTHFNDPQYYPLSAFKGHLNGLPTPQVWYLYFCFLNLMQGICFVCTQELNTW